ncbi:C4-dicarboxylate ABC transporter permease [Limnohabitans curvus]|jgi:TRAP-type C4-dicarboxylate transport system permease small subunit|uniref:TRAP transporter small permease protein n=1 Tax=Limnohabitans curvus TaxID=323423 RepID=A0A315ERT9_9BURK|nr:TRAP transporter small permease [Limnohabitans curvus]PUE59485.1 C4-dicarboxylate ABC transporter permease [Limnohabitans curvus]
MFLRKIANAIGGLLFLALFLTFLVQITARFGFNQPLPWSDELAVILYLWVILWACAFVVPEKEHVMFDLVWNSVSPTTRRLMRLVGHTLIGGLAIAAIPASWSYVHFMAREKTAVLGLSFEWVFLPFVLLLLSLAARSWHGLVQAMNNRDLDIHEANP